LLSLLVEFSERGPTFVSARIRSIELQLQQVIEGRAGGDTLDEAADQARRLLASLASMSLQVRDLMPELSRSETTAQFARQWFERYVGRFFIGDYADLHKADHPLARRSAILAMARQLEGGASRERLLAWYADHMAGGDAGRADARLERSLRRLRELERIDEHLARLHDGLPRLPAARARPPGRVAAPRHPRRPAGTGRRAAHAGRTRRADGRSATAPAPAQAEADPAQRQHRAAAHARATGPAGAAAADE